LASCATDPYHAYESGEGYSEHRLSDTSWRVSFVGSSVQSQAAVERQLLHRAAELTLQSGHEWFVAGVRDAPPEEEIVVVGERAPANLAEPVWQPRWRRRSASRWTDWDPRGPPQSFDPPQQSSTEQQRFFATAEISMGSGPAPPASFDANAVLRTQAGD
jgi:hypothetical protein